MSEEKPEWMTEHEKQDAAQFSSIQGEVKDFRSDFKTFQDLFVDEDGKLVIANKDDVARLNNIVHNFLLGVSITEKTGKFAIVGIIALGGVVAGLLVVKGWVIALLGLIGFMPRQ